MSVVALLYCCCSAVARVWMGADDKLSNTQLQLMPVMYLLLELSDPT
jgi:hypothetical protein